DRACAAALAAGLSVFVVSTWRLRRAASQLPIDRSLRPPPYASPVSNAVKSRSHAASMIANASASDSPWPKKAGAEPIPPKLPQPSTIRESSIPDSPTFRRSTGRFYGRFGHDSPVFACPVPPPPPPPQ